MINLFIYIIIITEIKLYRINNNLFNNVSSMIDQFNTTRESYDFIRLALMKNFNIYIYIYVYIYIYIYIYINNSIKICRYEIYLKNITIIIVKWAINKKPPNYRNYLDHQNSKDNLKSIWMGWRSKMLSLIIMIIMMV